MALQIFSTSPVPGRDHFQGVERLVRRHTDPGEGVDVIPGCDHGERGAFGSSQLYRGVRPKPRLAWNIHGLTVDGTDFTIEGPASEEWRFRDFDQCQSVLAGLNELRQAGTLCDVKVVVGDQEFPIHKCVLAASSNYFKAMFTCNMAETHQTSIPLNGVESSILGKLIDYAYTSEVTITQENVQSLLSAANLLEMLSVRDACCQYLDSHMDETNCLGIQCFAEAHACSDLQQKARLFALQHFSVVVNSDEFVSISENQLIDLISNDDLEVNNGEEAVVFKAVLKWVEANDDAKESESRKEKFHRVLEHVRLPYLSPYYLHDCVEKLKIIQKSPDCLKLVEEARLFHLMPDRRSDFGHSERLVPRRSSGLSQVIVAVGGEDDKVVLRSVEYWDPCTNNWKQLACLPFAISKHGLVVSGQNFMYMAGGEYPDGSASQAFMRYDPVLDIWQEMASLRTPRSELGLAMLDGFVYAIGGWEGSSRLDTVDRYNPETNTWSNVANLKIAVTSPAVASCLGCLYVSGGAVLEDGDGIDLVQKFDSRTGQWSEAAAMLIPRSGSASCFINGYIYVIGGWHASTENTNKAERYDIANNQWSFIAPMNERRYRPGVAVVNGKIYVMGGEEGWDRYHDTIECYDPAEDHWEVVGEMSSSRSWLSCVGLTVKLDCGIEKS